MNHSVVLMGRYSSQVCERLGLYKCLRKIQEMSMGRR
jgi:hypothetical protein